MTKIIVPSIEWKRKYKFLKDDHKQNDKRRYLTKVKRKINMKEYINKILKQKYSMY